MTTTRVEIFKALAEMSDRYPDWRFGQMVSNISCWAKGPTMQAIWDVEDQQFLETIKSIWKRNRPTHENAMNRTHSIADRNWACGLEQFLHDTYKPPLNRIRPISPTNPKLPIYQDAAKNFRGNP